MKDCIEKELKNCEGTTISLVSLPDVNISKVVLVKMNDENFKDSTYGVHTNKSVCNRVRQKSDESISSGSSGYIEVFGYRGSLEASPKMDSSSETDRESDPSSDPFSTGSSPNSHRNKVSFMDDWNSNPALYVKYKMSLSLRQHYRNNSYEQIKGILKTGRSRQRTKSESSVIGKKETLAQMIKDRSISLERISWKNKSEFQQADYIDKPYHEKYAESKSIRKRKISESNSVCSEISVLPPSTRSSQESATCTSLVSVTSNGSMEVSSWTNRELVMHEKHSVHSGNYFVTDVCSVDSDDIAVINHKVGSVVLYDTNIKQFRTIFSSGKVFKAYKMVWLAHDTVYILFKTRGFSTNLIVYRVCRYRKPCGKLSITGLRLSEKVHFGCAGHISDIKYSGDLVVAICFNQHVHLIKEHQELRYLHLDVCAKSWWPHSIAVHESMKYVYVFDLYSQKLLCFDIDNGLLQWDWLFPENEGIDGMITDGKTLYLAQNQKGQIAIMNVGNHEPPICVTIWSEDVRHPFALFSDKTKLLMTQFHKKWQRVNRTVKCF